MSYLVLAIISSALTSIVMRFGERHVNNNMGMFAANYGVCVLLAGLFMGDFTVSAKENGMVTAVLLGVLAGSLFLGNFVLLKNSMKQNGIILSTTFMKLGVLVPTLLAVVAFRERPSALQVIGILLALLAIFMIHFEKEAVAENAKKGALIILLVISGITDSMANIYDKIGVEAFKDHYLFFTFLVAFLLALVLALRQKISKKDILFGIMIGVPNYFSARFLLLAVGSVPAVIVYPVYCVAAMVIISLVGIFAFREHLDKKKAVALGIIMVSLVLLNI